LLLLHCGNNLTAHRYIRDASLWRKVISREFKNFEVKKKLFFIPLFGASSAPNLAANRRTN
jgi:hypothetical protein